jgi:hypothetical protein
VPERGDAQRFHPFVCIESDDEPALLFLKNEGASDIQKRITFAFSQLLIENALSLSPYHDYCLRDYDCGEYSLVRLGLDRIGFFQEDLDFYEQEERVLGYYDGHLGIPGYESQQCPECGGSGEESFFPAGQTCEICGGLDFLTWIDRWFGHNRKMRRSS